MNVLEALERAKSVNPTEERLHYLELAASVVSEDTKERLMTIITAFRKQDDSQASRLLEEAIASIKASGLDAETIVVFFPENRRQSPTPQPRGWKKLFFVILLITIFAVLTPSSWELLKLTEQGDWKAGSFLYLLLGINLLSIYLFASGLFCKEKGMRRTIAFTLISFWLVLMGGAWFSYSNSSRLALKQSSFPMDYVEKPLVQAKNSAPKFAQPSTQNEQSPDSDTGAKVAPQPPTEENTSGLSEANKETIPSARLPAPSTSTDSQPKESTPRIIGEENSGCEINGTRYSAALALAISEQSPRGVVAYTAWVKPQGKKFTITSFNELRNAIIAHGLLASEQQVLAEQKKLLSEFNISISDTGQLVVPAAAINGVNRILERAGYAKVEAD